MKYTPDEILDAAVVVVANEGIGVSTNRIAKAAGVSNGTLFNYFATKQDLLDAMYLHVKHELADAIGELEPNTELRGRAKQVWDRWIAWARGKPASWKVARMLQGADLISESVVDDTSIALAVPMQVLTELEQLSTLAELPVEYVGAIVQAQLDVAIDLGLDAERSATAFDVMWNGITHHPSTVRTTTGETT